ncbi:Iduronate 2-sulfatase [Trachymyrmex zeteki]|uniref:Iduronate 2-sulfatase n=1 Tax=Mycetomoellerius zeteki TaxID=64791 RepID=A0A151X7C6_9HYME|nr:Iduronate 2-sulfatase [Trachymyrmex zeteki]
MFFVIRFNIVVVVLIFNVAVITARPNILLIIVDDLRTTLGCYDDVNAYTPNIDALAEDGIVFTEAFAQFSLPNIYIYIYIYKKRMIILQQALCAPSRNSFLTGRRPDTLRLYDFYSYWRDAVGNYTTLPEHLKNNGYTTMSIGKVFHPEYHPIRKFKMPKRYIWPDNINDVAYNPWTDLRWRKDVAKLKLKFPWERIPERFAKQIIQSYYAAVSYIDNMIGKLIRQLHVSMIRENTIVILTSDHGWALGEHAVWSKYSNFDVAVHVPLIIIGYVRKHKRTFFETYVQRRHNKSMRSNALHSKKHCRVTNAIVELVDIFPTIADLANVPIPICQVINSTNDHLKNILTRNEVPNPCSEGITLLPLIKSTLQCQSIPWKKAAFSQYPRPEIQPMLHPNSDKPRLKEINIMGYTLKTNDYRYTVWIPFAYMTYKPDWDVIIAEELYDHKTDRAEDFNIAALPEMLKTKKYLRVLLKEGWRNALPKY